MTNLVKRNQQSRWLDPMFEDFFSVPSIFASSDRGFAPRVDIRDADDHLSLRFEVPGMEKENIKVGITDRVLTVSGERQFVGDDANESVVRREISTGSFQRQFTLPDSVDANSVKAEYKNGILEVRMDKREEAKPREISINVK